MKMPGIVGVKDNGDGVSYSLLWRKSEKGTAKRIGLARLTI
jgi:hypothetical protein